MKLIKNFIFIFVFILLNIILFRKIKIDYLFIVLGIEILFFLGIGSIFLPKIMIDLGFKLERKKALSFIIGGFCLLFLTFFRYILFGS